MIDASQIEIYSYVSEPPHTYHILEGTISGRNVVVTPDREFFWYYPLTNSAPSWFKLIFREGYDPLPDALKDPGVREFLDGCDRAREYNSTGLDLSKITYFSTLRNDELPILHRIGKSGDHHFYVGNDKVIYRYNPTFNVWQRVHFGSYEYLRDLEPDAHWFLVNGYKDLTEFPNEVNVWIEDDEKVAPNGPDFKEEDIGPVLFKYEGDDLRSALEEMNEMISTGVNIPWVFYEPEDWHWDIEKAQKWKITTGGSVEVEGSPFPPPSIEPRRHFLYDRNKEILEAALKRWEHPDFWREPERIAGWLEEFQENLNIIAQLNEIENARDHSIGASNSGICITDLVDGGSD